MILLLYKCLYPWRSFSKFDLQMCQLSRDVLKVSLLMVALQHFCFFESVLLWSEWYLIPINYGWFWRVLQLLRYYSIWIRHEATHETCFSLLVSALIGPKINATSFTGQLDCRFCYLTVRIQPKMLFANLLLEMPESDLRSCEAA